MHIKENHVGDSMSHMVMYNERQTMINKGKFVSNNKKLRKFRIHIFYLNKKKKGRDVASCNNSKTTIKTTHNSRYIHNDKSLKEV